MYERALRRYEEVISQKHTYPLSGAQYHVGLASLFECKHWVEDAEAWYSKVLSDYENVVGSDNAKCQTLRDRLASLREEKDKGDLFSAELSAQHRTPAVGPANIKVMQDKPVSRWHRLAWKFK
jgi:hypothetical protein